MFLIFKREVYNFGYVYIFICNKSKMIMVNYATIGTANNIPLTGREC